MPNIITRNCSSVGRDVRLPKCPNCKITYTLYNCGCYDMSHPTWGTGCSTCVQWRPKDLKPEPTSIPRIIANVRKATCGNEDCVRISKLPTCTDKRGLCTTRFCIYACGEIKIEEHFSRNCELCRPKGHLYPATRPVRRPDIFAYQRRPKIEGVCKDYGEHERQRKERQDAAEMARRTAKYEDSMRYERDREAAGNQQYDPVSQRNVEAYGFPAPTYSGQQYAPPRWPDPQAPGPSHPW
ncbi:uncharacterized protein Bfra_006901 [Botrytis fragariae]|uniref:Uncharacterized protein n=1 Tax=Botrytis fragariae TaxID=1964551 RepID=A0A8H6B5M9_9HELO|nr:uncharacterized protein Bfra_006901 [Botrytis fragariae]KAF5879694.1 hypothetical protein Bfra_006901 [Botrytis fragariae]